jgi:tetratricopeptide (TPR) repeat protein
MRLLMLGVTLILASTSVVPARAGFDDDKRVCDNIESDLDAGIGACTRIITSGRMQGEGLAIAYFKRGWARARRGDHDGAIADFSQVIANAPTFAEPFFARAIERDARGDVDGAMADYNAALQLQPKYVGALINRGNLRKDKGDMIGAIADYSDALQINPNVYQAYDNRAEARLKTGDLAGAIADSTQAIQLNPNDTAAYVDRGNARRDKGDFDLAIADYDQAIRLDRNSVGTYNNRGNARADKGDLNGAIADYDEAIRLEPKDNYAYIGRGIVRGRKGDFDGAIGDFTHAIQLDPKNASTYLARGNARASKGDLSDAISDYTQAIQLDSNFTIAYRNRGLAYEKKNDHARASADFETAQRLAASPNKPAPSPIGPVNPTPAPLSPIAGALTGKRVALVIGNSSYINVPRLANPANDAKLTAEILRSLGFTLVGGGAQLDLDKAGVDRAVQSFGAALRDADVGLFYYAGHGVQVRGANYLVPVDANPTREADVDFQMLDANLVLHQMTDAGTKLNLVILDACRNNPFGGRGLRAATGGLAEMRAPEGTLIAFATQPDSVAQDGGDGNSPYTKALTQVIRKPGLDIFRSFNEVGLIVSQATSRTQQPWFSASPITGEFYFAGAKP